MNGILEMFAMEAGWSAFLLDVSLKSALVLVCALAATRALSRSSASMRHHVWSLAFAAVLLLPLLTGSLPEWRVTVPAWIDSAAPAAAEATGSPAAWAPRLETTPTAVQASGASVAVAPPAVRTSAAGGLSATGTTAPFGGLSPLALAVAVWAFGALLLIGRIAVGVASAWWTVRAATPLDDIGWTRRVEEVAHELDIAGPVRALESPRVGTPMAWGIFRPTLLLPPDARGWSADRRRAVVLHELAHIKRHDCLVHLLAQAARAVHWLNPIAWIGTRRLRAERERACDDLVLTAGTRSADYARLLLDVARSRGDRRLAWATVSMARPSELEGRLLAILDPARDRRGLGRRAGAGAGLLAAAFVLPLAAFQAAPESSPQEAPAATAVVAGTSLSREARSSADPAPAAVAESGEARATPRPDAVVSAAVGSIAAPAVVADTLEERVLEALRRALTAANASVRASAAHALGQAEDARAVSSLGDALASDESASVRSEAAWGLGMIEDAAAVPALAAAASDESANVRAQVAWGLGMTESREGVPALLELLGDESANVRSQAAWALGMTESPDAVRGLIAVLASDDSANVRSQAAWALGQIEDERALDALIDAIEDSSEAVAEQAMWALGQVMGNS